MRMEPPRAAGSSAMTTSWRRISVSAALAAVAFGGWADTVLAQDGCTAILVGARASATGTPMTTHTMDCSSCDFRLAKVPEQQHVSGSRHNVVLPRHEYPRYVGDARGQVYKRENLDKRFYDWSDTPAIGSIKEMPTTYGYLDASYGIMNERQVAIGESTCGSRFVSRPYSQGGEAMFDVSALTRIALGRATTAREAIQIMGDLAVRHGFYGIIWEGDTAHQEAGEALTVTDTREAWIFHILPDDTGRSAIWAAQRIEDDHVAVVANQFILHDLNLADSSRFMASPNVYEVAIRNNIWRPDHGVSFDFTKAYSYPRYEGLQHYSTRRVWRVLTLANPSLKLSPFTDAYASDYPVSVKAANVLSPHDLMRFQRDHYEGTAFDMTSGKGGGPYGDPDRYDSALNGDLTEEDLRKGHFERAISIFRTSYSFVSVLNASHPDSSFIWFGQYSPHSTFYVPVFVKADRVPDHHSVGSLLAFSYDSAFWISALVGNWAARFYRFSHPVVNRVQLQLEQYAERALPDIFAQAYETKLSSGEVSMRQYLSAQSARLADHSHTTFTDLFHQLVTVFHDGYAISGFNTAQLQVKPLFYPKWWLQLVGFFDSRYQPAFPIQDSLPPLPISSASYISTAVIALLSCALGMYLGAAYYAPEVPTIRRRSRRRLTSDKSTRPARISMTQSM